MIIEHIGGIGIIIAVGVMLLVDSIRSTRYHTLVEQHERLKRDHRNALEGKEAWS